MGSFPASMSRFLVFLECWALGFPVLVLPMSVFRMCPLVSCGVLYIVAPVVHRSLFWLFLFCETGDYLLYCSGLAVSRPGFPFASDSPIAMWFLGISCNVLSTCRQCLVFSWLLYPWCGAYVANIVSGVCLLMI